MRTSTKDDRGRFDTRPCALFLTSLMAWCSQIPSAYGVVDANSSANTNAPPDGSPWTSVGYVNCCSGVYLGAGWVLTAAHVGPGNASFGGTLYPWDGTSLRLTNSDGSGTDMIMFHLRALPPLPRLSLATTIPTASSRVDMIGCGHIAGSAETIIGTYTGFYWSANQFKSWGNNRVSPGGATVINVGLEHVTVFSTIFSSGLQTSDEAQAAAGDSGGGVFQQNGATWDLVGMMIAIDTLENQPSGTAVYNNLTHSADIATYRAQIVSRIAATVPSLSMSRSDTNVMVCWPDTGVAYNLQANGNLSTTNWVLIAPALTLTNGRFCALLPATNSAQFFRLQKK